MGRGGLSTLQNLLIKILCGQIVQCLGCRFIDAASNT